MALQTKDFSADVTTSSGVKFTYILRVIENSTDIASNTSNITIKAILKQDWSGTMFSNWGTGVSCTLNGTQIFSDYKNRSLSGTGDHEYHEWKGDVSHNSDGSLTLNISGKVWQNNPTYFVSSGISISNKTMSLTNIPRASYFTSVNNFTIGGSISYNWSAYTNTFTHTVELLVGGSVVHTENYASGIATAGTSFTLSASELSTVASKLTNVASGTFTLRLTTKNGSSIVGTNEKTITGSYAASSFGDISGNTIGSSMTVNVSRKYNTTTNLTHSLWYSFGSKTWQGIASGVGTSQSFTPPTSLYSEVPSATSGTLTLILRTYNGTAQVGSDATKTVTVYVPDSVKPSFTASISRNNPSSISDWNVAVKGLSTATVTISGASAGSGSSIKSYSITGHGWSSSSASLTTGTLGSAGRYTFTCTVTDKRNRSSSSTVYIDVSDYNVPMITLEAYRCDSNDVISSSGTSLLITCNYSYTDIGNNSITKSVSCNGVSNTSFTSGKSFRLDANCAASSTYVVTATISDKVSSKTITVSIPTDLRPLNIKRNGRGAFFGGFATENDVLGTTWTLKAPSIYQNGTKVSIEGHTHDYAASSHTHSISNITNLQSSLDGKAASSHTHSISNITNLQSSLDGKAASSHTHSISNITNLQSTLNGKAASDHTHSNYVPTSQLKFTEIISSGSVTSASYTSGAFDFFLCDFLIASNTSWSPVAFRPGGDYNLVVADESNYCVWNVTQTGISKKSGTGYIKRLVGVNIV